MPFEMADVAGLEIDRLPIVGTQYGDARIQTIVHGNPSSRINFGRAALAINYPRGN